MVYVDKNVWNLVFSLDTDVTFEFTTDVLFHHPSQKWIVNKRIPHELTSLLYKKKCPLCEEEGISCKVATKNVNWIVKALLQHPTFQSATKEYLGYSSFDYAFVASKAEWQTFFQQ